MSFEALIDKVKQAEVALESHERQAVAHGRQLAAAWTSLWTPGRILLAGLGGGFAIGLLEPGKRFAGGRNALQMVTALAGLFAGGSAQVAAGKAEDAADAADAATSGTMPEGVGMQAAPPDLATDPEALRRAGLL